MSTTLRALSLAVVSATSIDVNTSDPIVRAVCDSIHGLNCYGDDLSNIGPVSTHEECCEACEALLGCNAWTWAWYSSRDCYLKSACTDKRSDDHYHSGVSPNPAPPAPPAPTPPPPRPPAPTPPAPPGKIIACGAANSIWGKEKGDFGACRCADPSSPMPQSENDLWTCSTTGDIAMDLTKLDDVRTCMSFSTEGSCEFKQKDMVALQVTLESAGCDGLWTAPLWIAPETGHWSPPQRDTGEIDIFERGCKVEDGYLLSLGSYDKYIWKDAWQLQGQPTAASSFVAYLEFDRSADKLTTYRCPLGSNPLSEGTADCARTHSATGYFSRTAAETNNGEEYMHFVSDVWNQCSSGCSNRLEHSNCNFEISNLKMRLAGPFRAGAVEACSSLLVSESEMMVV